MHAVFTFLLLITAASALTCLPGTFSSLGTCRECPPGKYQHLPNRTSCIDCPAGTFNRYAGAQGRDLCRPCGRFAVSLPGSPSCTSCKPGMEATEDGRSCVRCEPGSFIGFAGCETCEQKYISTTVNSRECVNCGRGFTSTPARTSCFKPECPPGREFDSPEFRGDECDQCWAEKFKGPGMKICEPCPPGSVSGFGDSECFFCEPGTRLIHNGFGLDCEQCPSGSNTVGFGNTLCRLAGAPCPLSYFETAEGDCRTCAVGYRFNLAKKLCEKCADNEMSPGGLVTNCVKCKPGQKRTRGMCSCDKGHFLRNGKCVLCPAGTYRGEYEDDDKCLSCKSVHYYSLAGADRCSLCPSGSFPTANADGCAIPTTPLPCPERPGANCISPKTGCPPGRSRVVRGGAVLCLDDNGKAECPPGKIFDNFNECISCDKGEAISADHKGRLTCKACKYDEISAGGLTRVCTPCKGGLTGAYGDFPYCVCRGIGVGIDPSGKCGLCPPGTEAARYRNVFNPEKDFICRACLPGSFSKTGTFEGRCQRCPKNEFSDKIGSSECKPCPVGMISYGIGEPRCQALLPIDGSCQEREFTKACLARAEGTRCTVTKTRITCKGKKTDRKLVKKTVNTPCALQRDCVTPSTNDRFYDV